MDHGILIAGLLDPSTLLAFLKGAFGLGIVIFVHELGHFLIAKACGVKCEKFYVGFDPPLKIGPIQLPRTLFRKQWGETEYGIGIIPLGGYVKMLGQDDNPANAAAEAERIRASGGTLDPRSYPAKSVPQRMAIISAGVIFNLIFGVLFATIAYKLGVTYTPTLIGGTSVGDPAWIAGIQPGDRIVSLEPGEPIDRQLRFRQDLQVKMFSLNPGDSVEMQLEDRNGTIRTVHVEPDAGFTKRVGTPTIGVWMAHDQTVFAVVKDSVAEKSGLAPGDRIDSVTVDGETTTITDGFDFQRVMARYPYQPLTLSVTRLDKQGTAEQKQFTIPVDTAKRFGIELTMGKIVCVQQDSVAEIAGFRTGDVMTQINGQPIGDPLTLPTRFAEHIGKLISITVDRNGSSIELKLTPASPEMVSEVRRRNGPVGLDPLGVGYVLTPLVANVIPNSPADKVGIVAGDVLQSVLLVMPEKPIPDQDKWPVLAGLQEYLMHRRNNSLLEAFELDKPVPVDEENNNWPFVVTCVQDAIAEFQIDLTYLRGSKLSTVRLSPEQSETMVDVARGFGIRGYEEVLRADTWSGALGLARREVWEGMEQVVLVLRKITSNYKNLGGPLTIATVATMEASEGLPRLLIFLTLLSANLAVLNFLPIPVLDGGHMLFLAYEGIVGKPVDERIQLSLTLVGFSLLMGLMVFVFGLDISRFLG